MATFEQFLNDVVVDTLETAFYGKNILPILSLDFPKTPGWQTILEDADTEEGHGEVSDTIEWEFGIEVLLTGEKYLEYAKELDLPASTMIYFPVNSEIKVSYYYSSGSYQEPPSEENEIESIQNDFSNEIWIEGETDDFSESTSEYFKKFEEEYAGETDEDMEQTIRKNLQNQLLAKIIKGR
jgi:hypothetical protein